MGVDLGEMLRKIKRVLFHGAKLRTKNAMISYQKPRIGLSGQEGCIGMDPVGKYQRTMVQELEKIPRAPLPQ